MRSHRLTGRLAGILILGFALVACGPPEDPGAASEAAATSVPDDADATVTLSDFAFDPTEITVSVGDTVAFVNEDDAGHTITNGESGAPAADAVFDEPVSAGQTVVITFDEAGTFPVTCTIHPDMQMTVVVEGS
jgi:plastocyanin